MAQAIRRPDDASVHGGTETHSRDRALAAITFVVGAVAFVTGAIPATHFVGAVCGLIAMAVGAYSQYVSESTNERWFNITGVIMGGVGFGLSVGNGGLSF